MGKKLGVVIDEIFALRLRKEQLNEELSEVNRQIGDLEFQAIETMEDAGLDKSSTGEGSVSLKIEQYPQVKDLNDLVNWAYENGRPDILQRRVTTTVFKEIYEETGAFPDGIDTYEKKTLNYRKK